MIVRRRRIRFAALALLCVAALVGCSSSDTATDTKVSTESVAESASEAAVSSDAPIDTIPAVDATTESPATDSTPTVESTVARLPDDDPTCVAIEKVKKINDQSGAITNEFIAKVLASVSDGDSAKLDAEFEKFLGDFSALSNEIMPDLTGAYASLATEQPQFAEDLEQIEGVTVKLLAAFGKMKASDLEKMEEFLAREVETDQTMAAGLASLKIDKFSRAACDLPFANT